MKIAYRVVTPIMAAAAVVMGFLLKMFSFKITVLNYEQLGGTYSFSIIETLQRLMSANKPEDAETATKDIWEMVRPIIPSASVFLAFLVVCVLVFVAIIFVSALSDNRKPVIILCVAGIAFSFACIIASNSAFDILMNSEEISLSDIVSSFSTSQLITLAAYFITLASAGLSAGFYAMFGIYILIIIWAIFVGYAIKTPIHVKKKEYRRSKPMKRIISVSTDKSSKAKTEKKKIQTDDIAVEPKEDAPSEE